VEVELLELDELEEELLLDDELLEELDDELLLDELELELDELLELDDEAPRFFHNAGTLGGSQPGREVWAWMQE
jgi:hypothetical protein